MKMRVFSQAHSIWGAIEPTDPKTKVEEKMDKLSMTAIYQSIPEDILLSIAEKMMTKEAWEALKTMCLGAELVNRS